MNTYMVHMLERAREVHRINDGATHRESLHKCPFCIADEDEQWFKTKNFGFDPPKERPEKSPAPHCGNCPLINVMHKAVGVPEGEPWKDVQGLMDDCVAIGSFLLGDIWEDSSEKDSY